MNELAKPLNLPLLEVRVVEKPSVVVIVSGRYLGLVLNWEHKHINQHRFHSLL